MIGEQPSRRPRLLGASVIAEPPIGTAFVPLAQSTVLFGPNGAGKSTVLRHVARHLRAFEASDASLAHADACLFFALLDPNGLDELIVETLEGLGTWHANKDDLRFDMTGPVPWPTGGAYPRAPVPHERWRDESPRLAWIHTVMRRGEPTSHARHLTDALIASNVVAVELGLTEGTSSVYWCLPAQHALTPEIQTAIKIHGLRGPESILSMAASRPRPRDHLLLDDAPVLVAPLGQTRRSLLPSAMQLPLPTDEVHEAARQAVVDLLVHQRWLQHDLDYGYSLDYKPPAEDEARRRGRAAWFADPEADKATVHPWGVAGCRFTERLANHFLPGFIANQVKLSLRVEPMAAWTDRGPALLLELQSARGQTKFPLSRAADGHLIWLELALLRAARTVRAFASILDGWADAAHDEDRELDFDKEDESDQEPGPCRARYLALIERVNQAISDDPEAAGPALDDVAAIDRRADQLFVIDEPERQLHPRLVRSAAAWLSDETRFGSSHWLLATHSPLLLRLGGSVQYVYLRPGSAGSDGLAIESIDPASLYGLSVIAGEMGFDRGELLTSVGLVIFVEGETDKAVLEGLFEPDLHHAGVAIVPMHGAVDAAEKGLVDAEMITRWTSARLGVLLDKLTLEDWAELQDDPDKRRKAMRGSSVELRAAARLTEAATRHERALHYLSLPVDDVFDALDPVLLAGRYGFPGHAEARAQAEANKTHWKIFYKERYGIDPMNADQLREVAVAMRHHGGELSQLLAALKSRVIRLSFGEKD